MFCMLGEHCQLCPAPVGGFLTFVLPLRLTSGGSWREFKMSLVHCTEHQDVDIFRDFPMLVCVATVTSPSGVWTSRSGSGCLEVAQCRDSTDNLGAALLLLLCGLRQA